LDRQPSDRSVDVYRLSAGEFVLERSVTEGAISPAAFPDVAIDLNPIWATPSE
jgi:Uma2 family endonuclease